MAFHVGASIFRSAELATRNEPKKTVPQSSGGILPSWYCVETFVGIGNEAM